jgi:hypothetical protein
VTRACPSERPKRVGLCSVAMFPEQSKGIKRVNVGSIRAGVGVVGLKEGGRDGID